MKKRILIISIIIILLGVIGFLSFNVYKLNKTVDDKTNWLSDYPEEFKEYLYKYSFKRKYGRNFYGYSEITQPTFKEHCKYDGQKEKYNTYSEKDSWTVETECNFSDEPEEQEMALDSLVDGKYYMHDDTLTASRYYYYNGKYFINYYYDGGGISIQDENTNLIFTSDFVNKLNPIIVDNKLYLIDYKNYSTANEYVVKIFDLNTKEEKVSREFKMED